tara:strand:+ start:10 stop:180 length:171 start_codon:yes stop_codon:yes gene_type:complete
MASKSIEEIAPVIRHLRIVIGTKILSAKTTIAAIVTIKTFPQQNQKIILTYINIFI